MPLATRFWAKVHVPLCPARAIPDERQCWLWLGAKCGGRPGGGMPYGTIRLDAPSRQQKKAHVVSWFLHHGGGEYWPEEGMDVCHRCDNPLCVNPTHLFIGSHQQNMIDYVRKYGRLAVEKRPLPPRPQLPFEGEVPF